MTCSDKIVSSMMSSDTYSARAGDGAALDIQVS